MSNSEINKLIGRIEKLENAVYGSNKDGEKQKKTTVVTDGGNINFELNEKAFVKRFASSKSGPKKFAILLAYLSKGNTKTIIKLDVITKTWGRMKAKNLLGVKFDSFYASQAQTYGWVNKPSRGSYSLADEWEGAL